MKTSTRSLPLLAACLALVAPVVACGGTTEPSDPAPGFEVARSSLPRDTTPDATDAEKAAVADGNLAFAQGLYRHLATGKGENAFFSPMSVTYALAMTWAGARGETATEMAKALGFTLPDAKVHASLNALDLELSSRGKDAKGKDGEPFRLRIVNSVWGERTATFEAPFLDVLAAQYDAGVRLVDFIGASEPSRKTINAWVEKETEDRIKDLLSEGTITPLTRLVLVNAVYFNGAWQHPFTESATKPAPFHAEGGDVSAPTMHVEAALPYATGSTWEAIALPYEDTRLQLVVVLPKGGTLSSLEATLDEKTLGSIGDSLANDQIALSMPKFKIEGGSVSLKPALDALGMKKLFVPGAADLTGMRKEGGLYVSDVVHRAFVEVDEKGTEAAAATAVVVGTTSAPPPAKPVAVDRPFAFFLRDVPTKTVLFAGHVTDPTK